VIHITSRESGMLLTNKLFLAREYFWHFRISWNLPLLFQEKLSEDGRIPGQEE
jgi:hypothetical protein